MMKNKLKKVHHCVICKKTFTSIYKLKSHLFYHNAVPARFRCTLCTKEYFRRDEYNRHMATHKNQQKLHLCDHCGRGFVDKRNLINHLYIHDDLHVQTKRYNCIVCNASYCEERLLKYHIRKHHMNLDNNVPIYTNKDVNESWIESAMNSENCVQITKVKNNVLSIKKCKIKKKIEKLDTFTYPKTNNNILIKTTKKKNDFDKNALQQYMTSVFGTKNNLYSKVICDYCSKEMLKKSLIVHIREKHMKIRRFHCLVCNRSFNRQYHLSDHNCGKVRRTKNNQIIVKKNI